MSGENICVLLTNGFPYSGGEPFLESEIPFLADSFDRILVFAIGVSQSEPVILELPPNVEAYAIGGTSGRARYLRYVATGLLPSSPPLERGGLAELVTSAYARGRAHDVARRCMRHLERNDLNGSNVIVYSYWFSYQALAACLIKDAISRMTARSAAVSRAHGYDLYWERNKLGYLPYQRYMLSKLDAVYTCSENGRLYLMEKHGDLARDKVMVGRLGTVDHGLGNLVGVEYKTFVTCCNFSTVKRMPLFANAFVALNNRGIGCRWLCIGDGAEMAETRRIIYGNGMEDRVVFMGRLGNKAVLHTYETEMVSFFCNVSASEGVPVSIMEAQSFGLPVIATNVGGVSEIVCEANGWLLSASASVNDVVEALEESLSIDKSRYKQMSDDARGKWALYSNAAKVYSSWVDTVLSLL